MVSTSQTQAICGKACQDVQGNGFCKPKVYSGAQIGTNSGRQSMRNEHTRDVAQCIFCDMNIPTKDAYAYPSCRGVLPA